MTRIISLANENWSHLKLELSMSFCSTNWPKSVTKFIAMTVMNLVAPKAAAKHELLFNKSTFKGWGLNLLYYTSEVGLLNI